MAKTTAGRGIARTMLQMAGDNGLHMYSTTGQVQRVARTSYSIGWLAGWLILILLTDPLTHSLTDRLNHSDGAECALGQPRGSRVLPARRVQGGSGG